MSNMTGTAFLPDSEWLAIAASLRLSQREVQILRCILNDDSEAAAAEALGMSPHTVHTHVERLYRKLGVNSRCQTAVRIFATYVALLEQPRRILKRAA